MKNSVVAGTFQATIGGKFAPHINLRDYDRDINSMITTYSTVVTETVPRDILDLCDERRDLKKRRYEEEVAKEYKKANNRIQKALNKAKEDWTDTQCKEIDACLNKNNSKKAYQLVRI